MEDVILNILEKPELKNTVLIEGLPGIGLVGKLAADHMMDELNTKKFAELYSVYLPPQVIIEDDGTVTLVKNEFYYVNGKKNDLIILVGDFQGITPDSQYKISEKILDLAEEFGVKTVCTLGGLGTGNVTKDPKVFGAATDHKLVDELKEYGVIFRGGGGIFGASGLLLGLGKMRNMDAFCLMGETQGQIIDAKSAEAVLVVLARILDIKIDMSKLEKKAKETEKAMKEFSKMIAAQKRAAEVEERQQEFMNETPSYIR